MQTDGQNGVYAMPCGLTGRGKSGWQMECHATYPGFAPVSMRGTRALPLLDDDDDDDDRALPLLGIRASPLLGRKYEY